MKKILGLDLGTNSIGWAYVNEAEDINEKSSIIKLGVRTISFDNFVSTDSGKESRMPENDFRSGKGISPNAGRTLKRSARRNLQRYKLRRENLIEVLETYKLIYKDTILSENGNRTTFETYRLRAKAVTEEISLEELSRVLLMINKKRGYKSSRKADSKDEGQIIDGMDIAKYMYDFNLTPGQYSYQLLQNGKKRIPDFYRSDLQSEFDKVWNIQKLFYSDILTDELKEELRGKNKIQTWAICSKPFGIVGIKRATKGYELRKENFEWRVKALSEQLDLEQLAIVLQEINAQLSNSSGYLGAIGDRSKELYFKNLTVGQYLMNLLDNNPNESLKNKVFYRQDYLDEFDKIWETQSKFHKELTPELKQTIRDIIIFYQRPLKSQKGLISFCEFESKQVEKNIDGKKKTITIGLRVCPKSSPLFQEFKVWQILNNLEVSNKKTREKRFLEQEEKDTLFFELSIKEKITKQKALKLLFENYKDLDLNYKEIEGNKTQAALFKAYQSIIEQTGNSEYNFDDMNASKVLDIVSNIFSGLNYNTNILHFNSNLEGTDFQKQPMYKLWHLLYSYEGDNSKTGDEKLINKITEICGFEKEYATIIANLKFQPDHGSLSTKAIRNILPYLKEGNKYSLACEYAGYRHSKNSLTKEEIENKVLKDRLEILPKNSLRNPVVEKILNQMINVVNSAIDSFGKPDEIRIELARELKKSAKERAQMTEAIGKTTAEHEKYRDILQKEFGLTHVSRNDITRYKLYLELKDNGFKTLYSDTYIPQEKLFSKEFDIEHIIPQAKLFDDSFSNKTLESRDINIDKDKSTAFDYVSNKYGETGLSNYLNRIELLFKNGVISRAKYNKLKMKEEDIPSDFINRDLSDTQYIAKKAKDLLNEIVRNVVSTTGSITDRLREDWQLIDVMQELNWNKYNELGLTEIFEDKDGRRIRRIIDWTKRNDHRHHAMDALTIAFTKPSYIQYLNNLNARSDKSGSIYGIEKKELYRNQDGNLKFKPPMPLDEFRSNAKEQLQSILISTKARNKVVTNNVNITKKKTGENKKIQSTPRGQLHNETIYGSIKQYETKEIKVGSNFTSDLISSVANKKYREALEKRLIEYDNDAKKAFTGKNSLEKNPIFLDDLHTIQVPLKVKVVSLNTIYTVRKEVNSDLNVDKVIDVKIKKILKERLAEFGNDPKKAFSNITEKPIWLNEEKGISIKRVTISAINNAVSLHDKTDKDGNLILDVHKAKIPIDFVSTGNNHHVAIFRDENGNLQENVVSFYEAVERVNQDLPIIDMTYNKDEGWTFLYTIKQNEFFVFPNEQTGFNPNEIDLLNSDNYALISPNLFRVQKISNKDYTFRHHLETTINDKNELNNITFLRIRKLSDLENIVKVRINHIGEIVSIGDY